jgi:uncharacterized membrane protein YphA (DoxX/SURF4 family)
MESVAVRSVNGPARPALARMLLLSDTFTSRDMACAPAPRTFDLGQQLFLRLLGVCLSAAFTALFVQAPGLIGSTGITPLADVLAAHRAALGPLAVVEVPSLFWLSADDLVIRAVAIMGMFAGAALVLGVAPRIACIACYAGLLSFRGADGGPLQWFRWPFDDALAEATFLAVFLAPPGTWRPRWWTANRAWPRLLLGWLLFRMLLGPGVTKLAVGGPWSSLDAVGDFLLTQPFPTATAAAMRDLPAPLLRALTAATLAFELLGPLAFCCGRRPRQIAAALGIALMIGIAACGNFRGLNILTIGLLLLLFDDRALTRWLPRRLAMRVRAAAPVAPRGGPGEFAVAALVIAVTAMASVGPFVALLLARPAATLPIAFAHRAVAPLQLGATYSMFTLLPRERIALVVQGSDDGVAWRDYEPIALPAAVDRVPPRFAPYQDYLGFRLWLAAYGSPAAAGDWLPALLARLRAGDRAVERLFARVPFQDGPPRHVRVGLYRYSFADAAARAEGTFWRRECGGVFASLAHGAAGNVRTGEAR